MKQNISSHNYEAQKDEGERKSEHSTTFSSHVWDLKDQNKNYEIKWNIVDRAQAITKKCRLCIRKKHHIIILQPEDASLNSTLNIS